MRLSRFVKKKYLTPKVFCAILPKVVRMDTKLKQAYLYDFYGELLNPHQQKIFKDFYFHDLSLAEIAGEEGISRQGVHDLIRRCSRALEEYESKLHLVEKFLYIREKAGEIQELVTSFGGAIPEEFSEQVKHIASEILEEL